MAAKAIPHTHARHFYGEVLSREGQTLVEGRFQQRPALKVGLGLMAGLFFLIAVFTSIRAQDLKPALIGTLIIAGGALMNQVQLLRNTRYEEDVRKFLIDISR